MNDQISGISNKLKTQFSLPVFEDEIAEDEDEKLIDSHSYNCIVYETGDMVPGESGRSLSQEIIVCYYSENRDDVDEQTVDIISLISSVKAVTFNRTVKERLKVKETDRFIDRVNIVFKRMIPIDSQV
jgi:hypothetical protein